MVNPTVTVLMTVYDPPLNMLRMAVESILTQTFGDFEFLIVNDGGQDPEVRMQLDSCAAEDPRVRLYHEPHRGVTCTSNRGLKLARGEYIARQDADDWSEPDRLAQQVAYLKEHPDVVLTGTDTLSHSADGAPLWRFRLPHTSAELARAMWERNPFVHGSTMFRREKALQVGGYREELPCSADYDLLWRLGKAVNLEAVLYHYRYAASSISARRATDQSRGYRAVQMLAAARSTGEPEDVLAALAMADEQMLSEPFRASLKQADHLMLAGDFSGARKAYLNVLQSHPFCGLAWAKIFRFAVFRAIPPVREACFR